MKKYAETVATERHPEIAEAEKILHAQAVDYQTAKGLAVRLKKKKLFGYARKLLSLARQKDIDIDERSSLWLAQQHALCTYKDPDLPCDERLERALTILESYLKAQQQSLTTTADQETLGIAGAIHKRKWEVDSQKQHLERSLAYYLRGYKEGPAHDYGYTGINAAFILDLLAHQEAEEAAKAGSISDIAAIRREKADEIRRNLIEVLSPLPEQKEWWFYVTVAEAFFGCGLYEEAREWLKKANALPDVADWERESTAGQLTCLADMHSEAQERMAGKNNLDGETASHNAAWSVLNEILGDNTAAIQRSFVGKIGLALSGGGFRASLFHIGVLAKLAERDALRRVEVLSCVSGGSIIGAHYYLEVRKLLRERPDSDIKREDYIEIVKKIEEDFLNGVQTNIRTRVAAEFTTNLKMIFSEHYSRTQRAGELYEEEIFSRVKDGEGDKPRWLNELKITPKGEPLDFSPKLHNWRRRQAKVPILILNSTALNTGHNWQFTASWMGEPPAGIDSKIDGNDRLRRLYYDDAPEKPVNHKQVRLGHAVAASACVPGLFEPLVLADLYPNMTARLVDGGVHDNQGISGLLEQDCTVLLVSDGSGQMDTKENPSGGPVGVPLRVNNILMARVREAEYHEVDARRRSSLLRGLMYVHLKNEIEGKRLDWLGCKEAPDPDDGPEKNGSTTSYSIPKEIQKLLAAVRTDLDSFSDAEAYALMTSGYRMTGKEFPAELVEGLGTIDYGPANWQFLAIEEELNGATVKGRDLKQLLEAASCRAFKIWKLNPLLRRLARVLALGVFLLLLWVCWTWWSTSLLSVGMVASAVATVVAGMLLGPTIVRVIRYRKTLAEVGVGFGLGFAGFLAARLHLLIFDPLYLKYGQVRPPKNAVPPQLPPSEIRDLGTPGHRNKNQRRQEASLIK